MYLDAPYSGLLAVCMPADRQSLQVLRVTTIDAVDMLLVISAELPNLMELIVYANGTLRLSFKKVLAAA